VQSGGQLDGEAPPDDPGALPFGLNFAELAPAFAAGATAKTRAQLGMKTDPCHGCAGRGTRPHATHPGERLPCVACRGSGDRPRPVTKTTTAPQVFEPWEWGDPEPTRPSRKPEPEPKPEHAQGVELDPEPWAPPPQPPWLD